MILYKVIFGRIPTGKREKAEEAVESYISVLLHNGQACGEYFHVVQRRKLCAYVNLAGVAALSTRYHSAYHSDRLNKLKAIFNHVPQWILVDDEAPKHDRTWARAPFLYLFTTMFDWESPLCRGDNGKPIPLYRLPGTHEDRESIYFWQRAYRDYDATWMRCGVLEIPVYKQLANPSSELSQQGLQICRKVELITSIPTYYYLMRYWGRRMHEENRKCPGCGRAWRTQHSPSGSSVFWHFPFQCDRCRLVSHTADVYDDERHAIIGEWKAKQRKQTKS